MRAAWWAPEWVPCGCGRKRECMYERLACACSAGAGEYWSKQSFAHLFATKCAANATFYGSGVTLWISGDTGCTSTVGVGPGVPFGCRKKERKQTTQGRDGDGTPPPHRDFKERSVVLAVAHPKPLVVCLFLSPFAVPRRFSLQPSCHLSRSSHSRRSPSCRFLLCRVALRVQINK